MRPLIPICCLVATLSAGVETIAARLPSQVEKTYSVGRGYAPSGRTYPYCRLLTVEMSRNADGSFDFTYRVADDQGKLLESESSQISVKTDEFKAFASICEQAWDLVSKRPQENTSGWRAELGKFHGEAASYTSTAYGYRALSIPRPGPTPNKRLFAEIPWEGVCTTLSLLSQTDEGQALLGDGKRFQAGIVKKPIALPFKEQEEIDLSGSIVGKFKAGNWDTWKMWVGSEKMDFRTLTDKERRYLLTVFARRRPQSESNVRMNCDDSVIIRLKLTDPETLKDLHDAFRVGYFSASDAADACRRATNVKLLPIAAGFLFTDKAPKKVQMDDVIVEESPGIHSASAIGSLLIGCPEFPEVVRNAAKTWEEWYGVSGHEFLEPCREWWNENRNRIEKGQYDQVTPPKTRKKP